MTVRSILKRGGGVTAVARSLRISSHAVAQWQQRGRIPPKYWDRLTAICKVSKSQLIKVHFTC